MSAQGEEGIQNPGGTAHDKAVDPAQPGSDFPQQQKSHQDACPPEGDLLFLPPDLPQIGSALRRELCAGRSYCRPEVCICGSSRFTQLLPYLVGVFIEPDIVPTLQRREIPEFNGMDLFDPGRDAH